MMKRACLVAILLLSAQGATAATIVIPVDQPSIAAGLAVALPGDTVLLTCAIYTESNLEMTSGVTLRGGSGDPLCTVIDAQDQGRVLACRSVDSSTRIEGITLTGGYLPAAGNDAAGLWIENGSAPTLRDCRIVGNASGGTGDAAAMGVGILDSAPIFLNCEISDNTAAQTTCTGGLACVNSIVEMTACSFRNNNAMLGTAGGLACRGGSVVTLIDCEFIDNHSHTHGAITCEDSQLEMIGCIVDGNSATYEGGGINASNAQLVLEDCLVAGGHRADLGGGLYLVSSTVSILGSTIASNETDDGESPVTAGGGLIVIGSTVELQRSVIWGNCSPADIGDEVALYSNSISFECCVINMAQVLGPVTYLGTNYDADPLFCDPAACGAPGGDYAVDGGSICLPQHNDCGVQIGVFGQGCGQVGVERKSWSAVKALY